MYTRIIMCGFIVLLFVGCHTEEFRIRREKSLFFANNKQLNDTLYLRDFVFENATVFSYFGNKEDKDRIYRYVDTTVAYNSFKKALLSLNLPIHFANQGNILPVDTILENIPVLSKRINHDMIRNIARTASNNRVIIPVMSFKNSYHDTNHGYVVAYTRTLKLSIYIIDKDEIIYYGSESVSNSVRSDEYDHTTVEIGFNNIFGKEPKTEIRQEQWDEIVHDVLWEFIALVSKGNN